MAALRKIGFDAICLNVALTELASLVGSKVQKVVTPNEHVVVFNFILRGATWLNIGTQPEFMTLFAQESPPERRTLSQVLRKGLVNSRLEKVEQVGFDRVFKLHFSHEDGPMTLVGELMGKHSNLVLLAGKRTIGVLKWVGPSKSTRPILPGRDYAPPPFEPKTPLPRLAEGADLKSADGVSPTVRDLLGAMPLQDLQRLIIAKKFTPCYSPGYGAYPFDLSQLGYPVTACKSFFEALSRLLGLKRPSAISLKGPAKDCFDKLNVRWANQKPPLLTWKMLFKTLSEPIGFSAKGSRRSTHPRYVAGPR